jgi:hypothetical protein
VLDCGDAEGTNNAHGREPASDFYARLSQEYGTDIDLDAIVRGYRRADSGPDL